MQQSKKHSARGTGTEGTTHRFARKRTNTALRATHKTRGVHPHRSKRIPKEKNRLGIYTAPFFTVSLRLKTGVSYLNAFLMHFCFSNSLSKHRFPRGDAIRFPLAQYSISLSTKQFCFIVFY